MTPLEALKDSEAMLDDVLEALAQGDNTWITEEVRQDIATRVNNDLYGLFVAAMEFFYWDEIHEEFINELDKQTQELLDFLEYLVMKDTLRKLNT